jgi:hypothetical protein
MQVMNQTIVTSPPFQEFAEKNRQTLDFLLQHAGVTETELNMSVMIAAILDEERQVGRRLPDWASNPQVMQTIQQLTHLTFCSVIGSRVVQRLLAGLLLQDTMNKFQHIVHSAPASPPQVLIYETHDSVIGAVLRALNVTDDEGIRIPPFGATVIMELVRHGTPDSGKYSVSASYLWEDDSFHDKDITPVHCLDGGNITKSCDLEDFIVKMNDFLTHDYELECKSENATYSPNDSIDAC